MNWFRLLKGYIEGSAGLKPRFHVPSPLPQA
jgi:hypothetical protein